MLTHPCRKDTEHLAAQRKAAAAAVDRAFATVTSWARTKTVRTAAGGRRPAREMSTLAQQVYEAVRAHPGESIAVIAAEVGQPPRALHRPMFHLKRAGRVRSVGQRNQTRYFPAVVRSA